MIEKNLKQSNTPQNSLSGFLTHLNNPEYDRIANAFKSLYGSQSPTGRPLGNNTESAAAPFNYNTESVNNSFFHHVLKSIKSTKTYTITIIGRYQMQEKAGSILGNTRLKACGKIRKMYQTDENVTIKQGDTGHVHYHGLIRCNSVWTCPVCAPRIQQARKKEVMKLMQENRKNGGQVLMVATTYPHYFNQPLKTDLKRFSKSLSTMKSYRAYKKLKSDYGIKGTIRALEVTHGINGWHPHTHELFILDRKVTEKESLIIQSQLLSLWIKACKTNGLPTPNHHGVKVDIPKNEDEVISYVSKWSYELTTSHTKLKSEGRTPWMILSDLTENYNYYDAKLFKEYAEAFKGRAQLYWSPGLKKQFKIDELNDEELLEKEEKEEKEVAVIKSDDWPLIVKFQARGYILQIAQLAIDNGFEPQIFINEQIERLRNEYENNKNNKSRLKKLIYDQTLLRYPEL